LVEQNIQLVFDLAIKIYVLEGSGFAMEEMTERIAFDPYVKEIYLGMA
jgi:ABC-type branched-subunit amino acid transport system ATPase component